MWLTRRPLFLKTKAYMVNDSIFRFWWSKDEGTTSASVHSTVIQACTVRKNKELGLVGSIDKPSHMRRGSERDTRREKRLRFVVHIWRLKLGGYDASSANSVAFRGEKHNETLVELSGTVSFRRRHDKMRDVSVRPVTCTGGFWRKISVGKWGMW
jgi:hypothetical protein